MTIKKHHVSRVEKVVEEEMYLSIKYELQDAINSIYDKFYQKYQINFDKIKEQTSKQMFEEEKLTMDLAALIKEQIKQNL